METLARSCDLVLMGLTEVKNWWRYEPHGRLCRNVEPPAARSFPNTEVMAGMGARKIPQAIFLL